MDERDAGEVTTDHYFEGVRTHISTVASDFEGSISAFTYPDAFAEYNGYGERETYRRFGFSYRTQRGQTHHQYHLVYGVRVDDGSRTWKTMSGETPDPSLFTWDIYGAPVKVPGATASSRLTLEAPNDPYLAQQLEDILYGTDTTEPRLPKPKELIDLYETRTILTIHYNGDGSYTASGPDDVVTVLNDGRFQLTAPTAFLLNEDIFVVNSY